MPSPFEDAALDQLFLPVSKHSACKDRPVPDELLQRLYQLLRIEFFGQRTGLGF